MAFVLGGGGVLGASEVGMLGALLDEGVRPDLVVGTSVGALNGAVLAADPTPQAVQTLTGLWESLSGSDVWGGSGLERLRLMARTRTALHANDDLRAVLLAQLGDRRIEDLPVRFECCAASIERAAEHWFGSGPLVEAVLASSAVPGLFPAVEIAGEHFLDGGIVNSVPVGRAVQLGARTVWVLQVGRLEEPLRAPTRPWEVATVAFEVSRRHRFAREMAEVPADVTVHVLPTGDAVGAVTARSALRYRDTRQVTRRIARAREATRAYLAESPEGRS